MRTLLALLLLLLAGAEAGQAAAPVVRPYALRSISLGVALADFRKIPHPDGDAHKGVRPICSDEPGAAGLEGLRLEVTFLQAGVIKCGYFMPAVKASGEAEDTESMRFVTAPIGVFGDEVATLFMFYKPDGATDYRLAQITFGISNQHTSETIGLFYRTYGNASSLDVSTVRTGFGVDLPDVTYYWNNGPTSIRVETISFVLNQMSVVMVDNQLWGDLHNRIATIEAMNRAIGAEEARRRAAESDANALPVPILPDALSTAPPTAGSGNP